MVNKNAINQAPVRKMADSMKTVVYLSLAVNAFEIYRFIREPAGVRQGISIALGIVGTILIWQFGRELQAEKKQALIYWLVIGLLGYVRWVFVDATFDFNILSMILISFAIFLTLRILTWVRNGLLT